MADLGPYAQRLTEAMPAQPSRSSARLLALLALMACGLAVVLVVATSLGDGGGSDGDRTW